MKYALTTIVCFLMLSTAMAQRPVCGHFSQSKKAEARVTVADPAEENYDVKYVKLDLSLGNLSTSLNGSAVTTAVTVVSSFSSYVFELDTLLTVDSAFINGIPASVSTLGAVRTVTVSPSLPVGTTFSARVVYHGTPLSGVVYHSRGMNSVQDPTTSHWVTYTSSECFASMEWWPCKQSLHDKIDSLDMWLTIPDSLKAGSNGLLRNVTTIDALHKRYEWHESYPIDYYLISLAVAPYVDYSYYMHFSGSADSMLVQDYIYNDSALLATSKSNIDSLDTIINYLSGLYGRYPFWHEKYGNCLAPLGGGMENETMSTILQFDIGLMVHELGHQWFGDNVTCGTWADIIMNEGFANYTGYLYTDHFVGHAGATTNIAYMQGDVKSVDTGTCYVDDTTSEARILDGRLTYEKGCCILHTLRSIVNDDSEFFAVFRAYQSTFGSNTGTIADFRNTAISILGAVVNGVSLDTFFNQWAYEEGFPIFSLIWNQSGTDVFLLINQVGAVPTSVPYFTLPLEVRIHSATSDTIVRVLVNQPSQFFHFTWSGTVLATYPDPNHWLIYKSTGIVHDPHLGVEDPALSSIVVSPNPTTGDWQLSNVPVNSTLQLTDVMGEVVWRGNSTQKSTVSVSSDKFPAGLYLLQMTDGTKYSVFKLIKL